MKNWQRKIKEYNKLNYEYLGLCACGMVVYSEWRTPKGEVVRIYYDN